MRRSHDPVLDRLEPDDAGHSEVTPMKDFIFAAITLIFFLLSWLYVKACERL